LLLLTGINQIIFITNKKQSIEGNTFMKRILSVKFIVFPIVLISLFYFLEGCALHSTHVYLTWQGDPHTTMTINVQSIGKDYPVEVLYGDKSCAKNPQSYQYQVNGVSKTIPEVEPQRNVHTFELTNLTPGALYYFTLKTFQGKYSKEYKFRTIPNDGSTLRFVIGGDMGILPAAPRLLSYAARKDPQFLVIGGDIAYANGDPKNDWIWDIWFNNWEKNMETSEGCLIPVVAGIGNHEVNKKDASLPQEERAPFYFGYFAQGGKTFFSRAFSPYLSLIVLDSSHITPVSEQVEWLKSTLQSSINYPYIILVYHVPLYPSHRSFDGEVSVEERKLWLPLFDEYKVNVCFENHDHTFKRTKPMRNGQVVEGGTVYLGDGCFGVNPRTIENFSLGYLEKADSKRHFWYVEINANELKAQAIDDNGNLFDEVTILPRKTGK